MRMNNSHETDLVQLIGEVRAHPAIWDATSKLYRDFTSKEIAWEQIAQKLLKSKGDLKIEWRKLKDSHRQALFRRKRTGTITKWRYEDQMKFLVNTSRSRSRKINDLKLEEVAVDEEEEVEENGFQPEFDIEVFDVQSAANNVDEMSASGRTMQNRFSNDLQKVSNYFQNKEQNRNNWAESGPDALDVFFESCALSVRKLPRRLQNRVKMDVLNSICRAEEDNEFAISIREKYQVPPKSKSSNRTSIEHSESTISPSQNDNTPSSLTQL